MIPQSAIRSDALRLCAFVVNSFLMKRRVILVVALLCCATYLHAEMDPASGFYVRFDAGFSFARDPELRIPSGPLPADLGKSPIFGGGIGYSFVPGIRTDFTVTYRSGFEQISGFPQMPTGNAELDSVAGLVSLYLNLFPAETVAPYAGFGLGASRNQLSEVRITNPDNSLLGTIGGKNQTNFAWQVCAGISANLSNRWLLDIGYHYLSAGEYTSQDLLLFPDGSSTFTKDVGKFRANELQLSLQYTF